MQKFKLEAKFINDDGRLVDGDLKFDVSASRGYIAACLYHILDEIGSKDPQAVEIATTRYYKKVLDL